jgi:T-complex protein 1 subunit alpha
VTVTNDGATILSLLDVEHPAGRILIELAQQQDKEVGDGTTSVVIIAAELLRRANELVKNKIHPTTIITGYRLALREATKYLQEALSTKVENLGKEALKNVAKTSMSSKIIGRYPTPLLLVFGVGSLTLGVIQISFLKWQLMPCWQ